MTVFRLGLSIGFALLLRALVPNVPWWHVLVWILAFSVLSDIVLNRILHNPSRSA